MLARLHQVGRIRQPRLDKSRVIDDPLAVGVTDIGDNFISVEIADNVRVRVQKAAVGNVLPKGTLKNL